MTKNALALGLLAVVGCAHPAPPVTVTSADISSDPAYTPPDASGIVLDEKALEPAKAAAKKPPRAVRVIAPNAARHARRAKTDDSSADEQPAE